MKDFQSRFDQESLKESEKNPQKKQGSKVSVKQLFWTIFVFLGIAFFFVTQRIEYIKTETRVRQLLKQRQELTTAILPLKIEERYLTQLKRVEKIAREELGLKDPKPNQIKKIRILRPVEKKESSHPIEKQESSNK